MRPSTAWAASSGVRTPGRSAGRQVQIGRKPLGDPSSGLGRPFGRVEPAGQSGREPSPAPPVASALDEAGRAPPARPASPRTRTPTPTTRRSVESAPTASRNRGEGLRRRSRDSGSGDRRPARGRRGRPWSDNAPSSGRRRRRSPAARRPSPAGSPGSGSDRPARGDRSTPRSGRRVIRRPSGTRSKAVRSGASREPRAAGPMMRRRYSNSPPARTTRGLASASTRNGPTPPRNPLGRPPLGRGRTENRTGRLEPERLPCRTDTGGMLSVPVRLGTIRNANRWTSLPGRLRRPRPAPVSRASDRGDVGPGDPERGDARPLPFRLHPQGELDLLAHVVRAGRQSLLDPDRVLSPSAKSASSKKAMESPQARAWTPRADPRRDGRPSFPSPRLDRSCVGFMSIPGYHTESSG